MENEQNIWRDLKWKDVADKIKCPLPTPADCRLNEGFKRDIRQISHSAAVFIAECNTCEVKASVMGDPFNDCRE